MSVIPNSVDNIFTYVLTNDTFTIDASMGVWVVAMKLVAGAGTFVGSLKLGTTASAPISLALNDPVTIGVSGQAIDSLVISAPAGTVQIIARRA